MGDELGRVADNGVKIEVRIAGRALFFGWACGFPKQIKCGCELFDLLKRVTSPESAAQIPPSAFAGITSCEDGAAMSAPMEFELPSVNQVSKCSRSPAST